MTFEELVLAVGLAQAVVICEDRLTDEFWAGLNFEQWYGINLVAKTPTLILRSLNGMQGHALAYEDWNKLYNCATEGSTQRLFALNQMGRLVSNLEQYSDVAVRSQNGSELKLHMLALIQRAEASLDTWKILYIDTSDIELNTIALRKIAEFHLTYEGWIYIYIHSAHNSTLSELAIERAYQKASTLEDWTNIVWRAPNGSRQQRGALKVLRETTLDFGRWITIAEEAPARSKIEKLAYKKAIKDADSREEYLRVYCAAILYAEIQDTAIAKIEAVTSTFEEWHLVAARRASFRLTGIALEKMANLARTAEEWTIVFKLASIVHEHMAIKQRAKEELERLIDV
ncbi:MAG: hypothetical protein Q8P30_01600 [Candidatus Uhrbacteria bacterium]|nr:hypothetical protein [Candidatus Uhrbacteria bacterium]